jgi:DNA-binding Xre family transcriptional regulator
VIKFYLDEILRELKISQTKFAKQANIRPNTINNIYNNKTKRFEIETLDKILTTLNSIGNRNYDVGDLIKFENKIEDNKKEAKEDLQ